jgi:hypothetical protein
MLPFLQHGAPPATQEEIDQVRGCTVKEGDELSRKECSICMDGMQPESHVMIMPCDHSFHDECLVSRASYVIRRLSLIHPVCSPALGCMHFFKKRYLGCNSTPHAPR